MASPIIILSRTPFRLPLGGGSTGGYFMFYCSSEETKNSVRQALLKFGMREMNFALDEQGARAKVLNF